jgi:hypothetical protein
LSSLRDIAEAACAAGFFAALVVLFWDPALLATPADSPAAVMLGAAAVVTLLWLALSGSFGYGSARRSDWVALVPFVIALAIRELLTIHSVQEIELQFVRGPYDKHSVVYPLLQIFFLPFVDDAHRFTMHMNGVLGALACLPLYLFVRQRLESRTAGFLCALFLAMHPLVARFSPTDGPYALLLFSWFSGLALLSAARLDARAIVGGGSLLGIAATVRIEGAVILAASLAMLDVRALAEGARRHRAAAVFTLLTIAGLVALQMHFAWQFNLANVPGMPTLEAMLSPLRYSGDLVTALVIVGVLSGFLMPCRLGLGAGIAMLVVTMPVAFSAFPIALHRFVPVFALQAMIAGIGAYALTAWLPVTRRWSWLAAVPGILLACALFLEQRGHLTKPYVFTEEYDLVRRHLVPRGVPVKGCTLLSFKPAMDTALHDFAQVVPHTTLLECNTTDCAQALVEGGCFYYVRSATCYLHTDGQAAACGHAGNRSRVCLSPRCAAFEAGVRLEPIEVRTLDIGDTFAESHWNYPQRAEIGLFRVYPKTVDPTESLR